EAIPARTEMVAEVIKAFLKEIISRFGIPGSLPSDNVLAFASQLMKGRTSVLGIKWTMHSAWRPHLSG
ncbi:hypothetical protein DBR06_SOUSAS6810001, partial [Sousa chinensis]